ncbi:LemA family protein [Thalassobellus suaedae]|uniref:LemA family protein n=1 Tax=Thalassobellus suaedae TaxID=3074124 RepID=A0ABY9XTE1_9FLAO|nr:LemA family protein [Flavobacteriaceae bacterium HL-DH14]
MKKKGLYILLGILALIVVFMFNKMTSKEVTAETQWADVESAYQRRADLIPNLVATVKGYAAHEKETLEGVIKARSEATKTTIEANNLTPETMAQFQQAQQGLSGALSRLLLTVERYPDLKANQNFLELQSQLEGTENRINVERNRFNDLTKEYNIYIRKFPMNFFAGIFGFDQMPTFKSNSGSENAPKVEF